MPLNSAVLPGLAAVPILLILLLMLGMRWSAVRSGMVGLAATLLIAVFFFGFGTAVLPQAGVTLAVTGSLVEAAIIALTILWIIYPALCIHELQLGSGSVQVLQTAIGRLSQDPRVLVLLVAWFFALFMEGAAGFGTAVALSAPFLVSAGFKPVEAVTLTLVGHAAGVSFGAVGTPILPQVAMTGFRGGELAAATGIYHSIAAWMMPIILMVLLGRSRQFGDGSLASALRWALAAAACFLVPFFLISQFVGPELPTLGGALFGGIAFVGILSARRGSSPVDQAGDVVKLSAITRAAAPYLLLVGLILFTRLIPVVQERLRAITLDWNYLGTFEAGIQILYHPGTMLLGAFLLGALVRRTPGTELRAALTRPLRQLLGVSLALFAMLGLSRVMVHSGMIDVLASAAASGTGALWPLFSPIVGVLGTFVTGSATSSNILFTEFQVATANGLSLDRLSLIGAQGFGAAVGNIICPHNIIAAGATVRLTGQEGTVLARTFPVAVIYTLAGSALAYLVFT